MHTHHGLTLMQQEPQSHASKILPYHAHSQDRWTCRGGGEEQPIAIAG
jgi:hypothetical protein